MSSEQTTRLTQRQGARLLLTARRTTERFFDPDSIDPLPGVDVPGAFGGVFVTLWGLSLTRSGTRDTLRGCRGMIAITHRLTEAVVEATELALTDPRFSDCQILARELGTIDIEVSVLSDPVRTTNPLQLIPGVHGLLIRRGSRSGCFLPKVATAQGWDAEQFLSACCRQKAGLPEDAWRDGRTEVLLFEAQVFREAASSSETVDGGESDSQDRPRGAGVPPGG
jgi:AmmeMemoRadiSam system protein A